MIFSFCKNTPIKRIFSYVLVFLLGVMPLSTSATPPIAAAPDVIPAVVETLGNVTSKVPPELLLVGAQQIVIAAGVVIAADIMMQPELPEWHAEVALWNEVKQQWNNSSVITDTITQLGNTATQVGNTLAPLMDEPEWHAELQLAEIIKQQWANSTVVSDTVTKIGDTFAQLACVPDSETQEIMQLVQWVTGMSGKKAQEAVPVSTFTTIPDCSLLKQLAVNQTATLLKGTEGVPQQSVVQNQPAVPAEKLDKVPSVSQKVQITISRRPANSIKSPKPVALQSQRSFNTLVTSDGSRLKILVFNSPAMGKARAQRIATLLDQRVKTQEQSARIAQQCKKSAERINEINFLKAVCACDPQFKTILDSEYRDILQIFEASTQLSTSPEIIARQLELAYYPSGYKISEAYPWYANGFKTTIQKLHPLMFNSEGRFIGITTPMQQKAAAEIYAGFLHSISFDNNHVFNPGSYIQKLKDCTDRGLPGFKKLYEDALANPAKLSGWKCLQKPVNLSEKIARNTFNSDLRILSELLAADKNDNYNSFEKCAEILHRYHASAQLQGTTALMKESQEQYQYLSKVFSDINASVYNQDGIRHEFCNDPLAKKLGQDIANNQISQQDANILLQQRNIAKDTIIRRLGLRQRAIPQALSEIIYGAIDRSYDLGLMTEYVVTQVSSDCSDKSKSELYPLLFNNQGVCCILPVDMSRLKGHTIPAAINTERCATERVVLNHCMRQLQMSKRQLLLMWVLNRLLMLVIRIILVRNKTERLHAILQ